ncbi:MAG: adenosylmethionine--8-amino-7-oxononanoate transaminase [Candidatus Omnitrophica bacterium]|nr:adenosylmethionine--8-amino-7-oxononanoate transaminase [Candidatus Omnitrophota bacterium]
MGRIFFVTGTDTGVGKTIAVYALALLLKDRGLSVGAMKPVQSGNERSGDAQFLKKGLGLTDDIRQINPYSAKEPLSPHLALNRDGIVFSRDKVLAVAESLSAKYDMLLVEGAGGLLVPIAGNYLMADLARDLGAEVIIVSRLGLGTINHTLLTVREAQRRALVVAGIVFSDITGKKRGIPEQTNAQSIQALCSVPVLGEVPFLKKKDVSSVVSACRKKINIQSLLGCCDVLTKKLVESDKNFVWHPFTQMRDWESDIPGAPLVINRAQGSLLIDTDGKRYIDGTSSLWVTVHGHGRPEITEAIACQAAQLDHSTMLGLTNTPAVQLAEKLIGISPRGLKKVFYSDNGSTAVEIAVKMSYQFWQNTGAVKKTLICHLENSYHGDTLGSVSIGGIDLFHKVYRKLVFKTHQVAFPDCYRDTRVFEAVDVFEAFLKKEHARVASLVIEPIVQGAAGMFMWPAGVLKRFEEVCRKYDVLLICDEVATGFGRTGAMFACAHEDVHPDLMCVAKGLSGGVLPLAATLTTQRIYDGFKFPYKDMKTFFHGHTYTGNPIACAAALANLELFKIDKTLEGVRVKAGQLARGLERFRDIAEVGDIRQRGLMAGIELVKDRVTKEPFDWKERIGVRVCQRARDYGVMLRPLGNVIVLMPPLSISAREIDIMLDALERAINDVLADVKKPYCGC